MSGRAMPAAESHPGSDNTNTARQEQQGEQRNAKEKRGWITEDEWAVYIQENSNVDHGSPSAVSIFRVPNGLIKESKKHGAYIPERVSLGPYHHKSAELRLMDHHKGRALRRMMKRLRDSGSDPYNMDFSAIARNEILQLVDQIKGYYAEEIVCNENILAAMLTLDGCFILEILRAMGGEKSPEARECYEPIFHANTIFFTGMDILNDILKLENQIPFIVLRKLVQLELTSTDDIEEKLFDLLSPFVYIFYPFNYMDGLRNISKWSWRQPDEQEVHHLLHLLHTCIVSHSPNGTDTDNTMNEDDGDNDVNGESIPHAAILGDAGIKFQGYNGGIKEIKFDPKSATIYLPPIYISKNTETVFRNLTAFEMCKSFEINYVACYLTVMKMLIGSEKDVALLKREGIVTNCLESDKEVVQLFDGLCKGVVANIDYVFHNLTQTVKVHRERKHIVCLAKLHKDLAELKEKYFSSTWKALGVGSAAFLLILTVLQTVFTILTFYDT